MKAFHTTLVNGKRGDPALYVLLFDRGEAFLFDMGDLSRFRIKNLHKVSRIFISHSHIDHFIGFDYFLRVMLGQKKKVEIYGPPGISDQVFHRLQGYTWNLVKKDRISFHVYDVFPEKIQGFRMQTNDCFSKKHFLEERNHQEILFEDEKYQVKFAILDHGIPSLAYSLVRKNYERINKAKLQEYSLSPGQWVGKVLLFAKGKIPDEPIELEGKNWSLSQLAEILVIQEKEEKMVYVVDTIYNQEVEKKVINLAKNADVFFCETSFLWKDRDKAKKTRHLLAIEAGRMARKAGAKKFIPFHFSWGYQEEVKELVEEGRLAYLGQEKPEWQKE